MRAHPTPEHSTPDHPTFVLAGAAKSGTTTLVDLLAQHPDVHVCPRKEAHHYLFRSAPPAFRGPGDHVFGEMVVSDPDEWAALMAAAGGARARGEASVYYLHRPEVWPRLVAAAGEDLKVIVILRDPVARAVSAWGHLVRDGREHLDLAEALDAEADRRDRGWEWCWGLVGVGRYAEGLEALLDHVDRGRVLVLGHDELAAEPQIVARRAFAFLGVEPGAPVVPRALNRSGVVRSRRVHDLLTRPHPAKDLLRPFVPDRVVQSTFRAVHDRNLATLPQVLPDAHARLVAALGDQPARVAALTGLDTSGWCRP